MVGEEAVIAVAVGDAVALSSFSLSRSWTSSSENEGTTFPPPEGSVALALGVESPTSPPFTSILTSTPFSAASFGSSSASSACSSGRRLAGRSHCGKNSIIAVGCRYARNEMVRTKRMGLQ